jgi:hypothetical protein
MNRRIAALRGLCEHAVLAGVHVDNPVPAARRGLLEHAERDPGECRDCHTRRRCHP